MYLLDTRETRQNQLFSDLDANKGVAMLVAGILRGFVGEYPTSEKWSGLEQSAAANCPYDKSRDKKRSKHQPKDRSGPWFQFSSAGKRSLKEQNANYYPDSPE